MGYLELKVEIYNLRLRILQRSTLMARLKTANETYLVDIADLCMQLKEKIKEFDQLDG